MIEASTANRASTGDRGTDCTQRTECDAPSDAAAKAAKAWADGRDAIARIASTTADARVYAFAYKLCKLDKEGACQMMDAGRWAQLDPGTARPWVYILADAAARGDLRTQAEALHRISTSQRSTDYSDDTAGAILGAAPSDDAALPAVWAMLVETIGLEAAVYLPIATVTAACKGDALGDSNRAQTCADIAEVLTQRSLSIFDNQIGVSIGRRLGWPADRIDVEDAQFRDFTSWLVKAFAGQDSHLYGCEAYRKGVDYMRRRTAIGEAGVLREWVAESGKTPQQFIDEERAFLAAGAATAATRAASTP
jgi:hypothetical protein